MRSTGGGATGCCLSASAANLGPRSAGPRAPDAAGRAAGCIGAAAAVGVALPIRFRAGALTDGVAVAHRTAESTGLLQRRSKGVPARDFEHDAAAAFGRTSGVTSSDTRSSHRRSRNPGHDAGNAVGIDGRRSHPSRRPDRYRARNDLSNRGGCRRPPSNSRFRSPPRGVPRSRDRLRSDRSRSSSNMCEHLSLLWLCGQSSRVKRTQKSPGRIQLDEPGSDQPRCPWLSRSEWRTLGLTIANIARSRIKRSGYSP
jgi:hypothetical protein